MTTETTFGAELRRVRQASGYWQPMLARHVGITHQYLSELERSVVKPSARLADALPEQLAQWGQDTQHLRELAFRARGESRPTRNFEGEEG